MGPFRFQLLGPALLVTGAFGVALFYNGQHVPLLAVTLVALMGALAWTLAPGIDRGWRIPPSATAGGLVVLWAFWAVSLSWSHVPHTSHLYYWWLSALPVTFFALLVGPYPRRLTNAVLALLAAGTAVLAVTALVQFFGYPEEYNFRASGPLLNPNNLAALFNLFLLPALALALTTRPSLRRWLLVSGVVLLFAGVMATQSRGALIGTVIAAGVVVAMLRSRADFPWRRLAGIGAACGAVFLGMDLYADAELTRRVETLGAIGSEPSLQNRFAIWEAAWAMVQERPWLGTGLGTFFLFYPRFRLPADTSGGFYAHMDPLQFWLETGVLGPVLFYAVLTTILVRTLRAHRRRPGDPWLWGSFAGLLAVALHTHITFNLYILPVLIAAGAWLARWHLASEAGGAGRRRLRLPAGSHPRVWRWSLAGFLALVVINLGAAGTGAWLVQKGRTAVTERDMTGGLAYFRYARALTPASDLPYALGAEVYINALEGGELTADARRTAFRRAERLIDRARARNPAQHRLPYLRGRLYRAAPDGLLSHSERAAVAAFREALALNPRYIPARRKLAELLRARGQEAEALRVLKAGLRWPYPGEKPVGLHIQTAQLQRQLDRPEAARTTARKALERIDNPRFTRKLRQRFDLGEGELDGQG